jgi:RHS repeat-associated protein
VEEVSTSGGTTTTTTYYYAGGQRIALAVNGVFSYLASDSQGTPVEALSASGTVTASMLYDPYGNVRYSSGIMPGSAGYTGQHADAATGLDYYNARYYDPTVGQFTSADTQVDGLNRYGYVHGNPETATDPTGHDAWWNDPTLNPPNDPPPSGGGGGGGKTRIDCNSAIGEYYDQCDDYRYDRDLRITKLSAMQTDAGRLIVIGSVAGAVLDLVELWYGRSHESGIATLEAAADLFVNVASALTYVPIAFGGKSSSFNQLASFANNVAMVLRYAIAFFRERGAWVQWAVDRAVDLLGTAVQGLPGLAKRAIAAVAGPVILSVFDFASGGLHRMVANGFHELADYYSQLEMDVPTWCRQNSGAGCHGTPSQFVWV